MIMKSIINLRTISLMLICDKIDFTIRSVVTEIWKRPIKCSIRWKTISSLSRSCLWSSRNHVISQESQRGRDSCLFLQNYYYPCKYQWSRESSLILQMYVVYHRGFGNLSTALSLRCRIDFGFSWRAKSDKREDSVPYITN